MDTQIVPQELIEQCEAQWQDTIAHIEAQPQIISAHDLFTALALAALVELGTAYYTVLPHMSDSLRDAMLEHLDFCMDVVGVLPHSPGRGVQVVHGNRRYEWAVSK